MWNTFQDISLTLPPWQSRLSIPHIGEDSQEHPNGTFGASPIPFTPSEEVEDGNLSGVATIGRTGVDMWRKSLGLDTTSSSSSGCGISFSFVMRQDGNATVQQFAPSTMQPVTLDAEEVATQ